MRVTVSKRVMIIYFEYLAADESDCLRTCDDI